MSSSPVPLPIQFYSLLFHLNSFPFFPSLLPSLPVMASNQIQKDTKRSKKAEKNKNPLLLSPQPPSSIDRACGRKPVPTTTGHHVAHGRNCNKQQLCSINGAELCWTAQTCSKVFQPILMGHEKGVLQLNWLKTHSWWNKIKSKSVTQWLCYFLGRLAGVSIYSNLLSWSLLRDPWCLL